MADVHTVTATMGQGGEPEERTYFAGAVLLDRYRIESVLGRGGMGTVYLAEDRKLGQRVALKFLAAHLADRPKFVEMLLNEVRVARQVTHPNVCRVHDVGEVDGLPFLSMEYVDGEDLGSLLRRIGRLSGEKAHQIARQLCAGLFAAHEKGVLHRDLKPGNVMIDGEGNVRITDFGIATAVGAAQIHEGPVGSPAYMAPELFHGEDASVESDVYALGLVLHELYTGVKLHSAGSMSQLMAQHEAPRRPPSIHAPGLDRDVERAILAAIDPDPAKRPSSAMALLAMLPGGDPLAESLAAGKTPSPELIAAAGGTGGLEKPQATALVAAVLLALAVLLLTDGEVKRIRRAALPLRPDVLVDRARTHLRTLGFRTVDVDTSSRFQSVDRRVEVHCEHGPSDDEWTAALADPRAASIEFWYRQTPRPARLDGRDVRGRVGWNDPPLQTPGEARVRLDPTGRLVALNSVPLPGAAAGEGAGGAAGGEDGPSFARLFEAAGLDGALLREIAPTFVPPTYADRLFAWEGTLPEDLARPVRVEAASFDGLPVAFTVTVGAPVPPPQAADGLPWRVVARIALILAALVLAFDAQRRGRGDPRGTFRVFLGVFVLVVLFTMLAGDGTDWAGMGRLLQKGMMHGVAVGGMLALYYFAFEPHARHVWPQTMLGSSRLLAGRPLDPRVGRDVLLGVAMGAGVAVAAYLSLLLPAWTGCVAKPPMLGHVSALDTLLGAGSAVGVALEVVVDFAREAFKFFMAIVVLRLLLRNAAIAAGLAVAIWTLAWRDAAPPQADSIVAHVAPWIWSLTLAATSAFAVVRFGLLSLVVTFVTLGLLVTFPLSVDLGDWVSRVSILAVGGMLALTLLAARTATRSAPARFTP